MYKNSASNSWLWRTKFILFFLFSWILIFWHITAESEFSFQWKAQYAALPTFHCNKYSTKLLNLIYCNMQIEIIYLWYHLFRDGHFTNHIVSHVRVSATVNDCGLQIWSLNLLYFLFTELLTIISHSDNFNYTDQRLPCLLAHYFALLSALDLFCLASSLLYQLC
jgi:hypothetical protein